MPDEVFLLLAVLGLLCHVLRVLDLSFSRGEDCVVGSSFSRGNVCIVLLLIRLIFAYNPRVFGSTQYTFVVADLTHSFLMT